MLSNQATTAAMAPPRASLQGMPAELRNKIFALAIVDPSPIVAIKAIPKHILGCGTVACPYCRLKIRQVIKARLAQPALTQVCRQLRAETLPVFYGRNAFVLTPVAYLPQRQYVVSLGARWLRGIGPKNRRLLRQCYVYGNSGSKSVHGFRRRLTSSTEVQGVDGVERKAMKLLSGVNTRIYWDAVMQSKSRKNVIKRAKLENVIVIAD